MWNLIPQIFYDLIARVAPGATLIVLTLITLFGIPAVENFVQTLTSPEKNNVFTILLLLGGLGSYVVGFLLDWLWETIETIIESFTRSRNEAESKYTEERLIEHNRMQEALKRPIVGIKADDLPRVFAMRSQLRKDAPEEYSRLLKLRAERRLCQVLLMGFLTLCAVNLACLFLTHFEATRIVLEILLVVAVVACWGGAQSLHRQFVIGTMASWLVFVASSEVPAHTSQPSTSVAETGVEKRAERRTRKG